MTLHQAQRFMAAAAAQQRMTVVSDAIAARMAQADGNAWRKYITGLRGS